MLSWRNHHGQRMRHAALPAGAVGHAGASAAFLRALEIDPAYEPAWNNLGATLEARGLWPQALAAYRGLRAHLQARVIIITRTARSKALIVSGAGCNDTALGTCRRSGTTRPAWRATARHRRRATGTCSTRSGGRWARSRRPRRTPAGPARWRRRRVEPPRGATARAV
jgi:hypothetical protein